MQKTTLLALAVLLLAAASASAQLPVGQTLSVPDSLRRSYNQVRSFITAQAEAMPEAEYDFKPTPDVRSFRQLMGHIADYNYIFCAAGRRVANPREGRSLESLRTKAELLKALEESFAFCDATFASVTPATMLDMVPQNGNEVTRAGSLMPVIVHDYEEYGYAAVYLRLKGVVPPSTRGTQAGAPAR